MMADYLTRLAQRTLGVAPIARPDLAAMPSTASAHAAVTQGSVPDDLVADSPSPFSRTPLTLDGREPHVERADPVDRPDIAPRPTAARAVETSPIASVIAVPFQPTQIDAHVTAACATRTPTLPATIPVGMVAPPRSPSPPTSMPEPRAAGVAPRGVETSSGTVLPAVNITIGRIEVRSATRPQVTDPSPERRPRDLRLLSLESYLRQRNGDRA